jgi:O-methyltransferase involved in polyketide biosynthesis
MIAASVLDRSWMDIVAQAPAPYLFLADGVLAYLDEDDAHQVLAAIVGRFPGGLLAFDTCGRKMIDSQDRHDALSKMTARMRWACDTPHQLDQVGLTLKHSLTPRPGTPTDPRPAVLPATPDADHCRGCRG